MKLKMLLKLAMFALSFFFIIPVSADQNLACSTGSGRTCALHNQHDQYVGNHCQCDGGGRHHSQQGTVVNLVCSTHSGHTCSTSNNRLGNQCGCLENGHEIRGTVVIQHNSNQNDQHQNQNYRNTQH